MHTNIYTETISFNDESSNAHGLKVKKSSVRSFGTDFKIPCHSMQIERSIMTRHYSAAVRYRAIGMFEAGMTVEIICQRLDVPQATTYFWIRKFKKTGDVERREGSGRPPVTSKRTDRRLVRLAKSNRFASSSVLVSLSDESINPTTVRRRLRAKGCFSRRPKVHPLLSPSQSQNRSAASASNTVC